MTVGAILVLAAFSLSAQAASATELTLRATVSVSADRGYIMM
ncbi:hypothetical protein ABZX85_08105 [Streptomyces sp. NPDC004539]